LGGGDGGGFRGWAVVGESGRGDARVEVWVSASAFGVGVWRRRGRGTTRQLAPGGADLASWQRGRGRGQHYMWSGMLSGCGMYNIYLQGLIPS
jgi:hypothetical protein